MAQLDARPEAARLFPNSSAACQGSRDGTGWSAALLLDLPLEFVVSGMAVSHGAQSKSRRAWQNKVREAARPRLPEFYFILEVPVAVTIYFFPQGRMPGDIDNCIKPILDAMNALIYLDDRQVDRLVVQKFEPERPLEVTDEPTECLAAALAADDPVVYVKISADLRGE